jgi:NADH-quinone oxidoreductase subunit G
VSMKITINGIEREVDPSRSLLHICEEAGIRVPTLCYDERMKPEGACRLCVMEDKKRDELVVSCATFPKEGMVIETDSERVHKSRKGTLDLLFSNHPNDCLTCGASGACKLQDYCYEYGVLDGSYRSGAQRKAPVDTSNKFYDFDPYKCILCGKCYRMCQEVQCTDAIGLSNRGFTTKIATPMEEGLANSRCVSCGNCVAVCPTGALLPKNQNFRYFDVKKTRTTCSFCGVGCQIDILTKNEKIVGVEPHLGTKANDGLLCVKGRFSWHFVQHPDRLKEPLIKENGRFREASWEEALDLVASRMKQIKQDHGPDAIAGFSSARCTNEDNYLFQKLLRAGVGTNNVDHCARL